MVRYIRSLEEFHHVQEAKDNFVRHGPRIFIPHSSLGSFLKAMFPEEFEDLPYITFDLLERLIETTLKKRGCLDESNPKIVHFNKNRDLSRAFDVYHFFDQISTYHIKNIILGQTRLIAIPNRPFSSSHCYAVHSEVKQAILKYYAVENEKHGQFGPEALVKPNADLAQVLTTYRNVEVKRTGGWPELNGWRYNYRNMPEYREYREIVEEVSRHMLGRSKKAYTFWPKSAIADLRPTPFFKLFGSMNFVDTDFQLKAMLVSYVQLKDDQPWRQIYGAWTEQREIY